MKMQMTESNELTAQQAAAFLNTTAAKIRAYITSGQLDAWNASTNPHANRRRYRISRTSLEAFRQNRRVDNYKVKRVFRGRVPDIL